MTLGEKLQQLRKAGGLSQTQLAELLEVSRQSVSKWELNEAVPDLNKVVKLCQLFGITTDELLTDDGCVRREGERAGGGEALERIARLNFAYRQIVAGFITAAAGLVMLVLEYMFLPLFGTMQKAHVNGQGFYSDFIQYAGMEPMPTIFKITAVIILLGAALAARGCWNKSRLSGAREGRAGRLRDFLLKRK